MNRETGLLIRELRQRNNLSSTEFGKILNVNKSTVSRWESTGEVGIDSLYQIARYFRVTIKELLDGRLNTESNPDYFKRNYDLSTFNLDALINNKDEEGLVLYYEMCLRVKNKFMKLIPLYAESKLTNYLVDEFIFLNQFVYIDDNVIPKYERDFASIIEKRFDKNHVKAVFTFLDSLKTLSDEEIAWEMDKLVNFKINLRIEDAINTQSVNVLKVIMPLLTQNQKDILLEKNIHSQNLLKLSENPYVFEMINGGANIIYGFRDFNPPAIWDEETLPLIEGKIEIDLDYKVAPKENELNCNDSSFFSFRNGDGWKQYSLRQYKMMINQRKTKQLLDLFKLKHQNPNKYYENLIANKYDSSF